MLKLAALHRALAGALGCALILAAALTHQARADDRVMAYAPAVESVATRPAHVAIRRALRGRVTPRVHAHARGHGASLAGVYAPLAAKARAIMVTCGSRVVSGVRHTRVAGTGRMSQHATGHAVDMQGNPGCIYAHLRGWRGGYSTDYATAPGGPHVHVSLGGREDGRRFAHRHSRSRYAVRRHHHTI